MDKQIVKKKWTLQKISILSIAGLLLLFILYLLFIRDTSSKLNVEKEKISICEIKKGPFQEYIPIMGTIEPFQTFYLDVTDGGRIVEKYVEEGAFLEIGEKIIKLDNPNLTLQLMNTQSNFILAESQLSQTRLTFEQNLLYKENQLLDVTTKLLRQKREYITNKSLYEKNLCSENEYKSSKEEYEYLAKSKELMYEALRKDTLTYYQLVQQNETNVSRSKSYLQLVEEQLASLTVKSPIKGQLTSLNAEIGQLVGTGYKLGRIDNTDSYKIRAEIDEHYLTRVRTGLTGEYEFNGKKLVLTLTTIYPQITDGKFFVDMIFAGDPPKGIRRGQTVHTKLQLGEPGDALLLENGGFYSTTGGEWIFVLDKTGETASKRKIKIGRQNPIYFEVMEGLKEGEKVINSSYENYGDIDKLTLK
ncbi:MAG: HlyD family efflux transporter periplasmic adaptor subunit [bacterium]